MVYKSGNPTQPQFLHFVIYSLHKISHPAVVMYKVRSKSQYYAHRQKSKMLKFSWNDCFYCFIFILLHEKTNLHTNNNKYFWCWEPSLLYKHSLLTVLRSVCRQKITRGPYFKQLCKRLFNLWNVLFLSFSLKLQKFYQIFVLKLNMCFQWVAMAYN